MIGKPTYSLRKIVMEELVLLARQDRQRYFQLFDSTSNLPAGGYEIGTSVPIEMFLNQVQDACRRATGSPGDITISLDDGFPPANFGCGTQELQQQMEVRMAAPVVILRHLRTCLQQLGRNPE